MINKCEKDVIPEVTTAESQDSGSLVVKTSENEKIVEDRKMQRKVKDFVVSYICTSNDLSALDSIIVIESLNLISQLLPLIDIYTVYLLAGQKKLVSRRRSSRIMSKNKVHEDGDQKYLIVVQDSTKSNGGSNVVVVGALLFRFHVEMKITEILLMGVDKTQQCCGIGSMLLALLKKNVQDYCHTIVVKSDNWCIDFYKKNGFSADVKLNKEYVASCIFDTTSSTLMECRKI